MTKYKKLTKSTFAIIALSLVLVAVLAFGGTYAYFSANANASGSITTGTLKLTATSETLTLSATEDSLVPNQSVEVKMDNFKLEGNTVSALRMKLEITGITGTGAPDLATAKTMFELTLTAAASPAITDFGWSAEQDDNYYYSDHVLSAETAVTFGSLVKVGIKMKAAAGNEYQGLTISYKIVVEAAQAEYHAEGASGNAMTSGAKIDLVDAKKLAWPTAD